MAKRAVKKVVVGVICYSWMGLVKGTVDGNMDWTEVGKSDPHFCPPFNNLSEQVT